MARFDVAIPNYQYGRFLRDCVSSVLSQGIDDLRVLIIDNASTDDSAEVAQQLVADDPRIALVRHPTNLGHHASFNEAVDWADADYFVLLCSDDLLVPGALASAAAIMDADPSINLAFGRLAALPPDGRGLFAVSATDWETMPGRVLLQRLCQTALSPICGCATVVRTSAQKQVGYYRPSLRYTDDVEIWMRLAALDGRVAEACSPLALNRVHDLARSAVLRATASHGIAICEETFASFFAHEGAALDDSARLQRQARRSLVGCAYWSGVSHFCRGDRAGAAELFRFAFARSRSAMVLPPFDFLFRKERVAERIAAVLSEAGLRLARHATANGKS